MRPIASMLVGATILLSGCGAHRREVLAVTGGARGNDLQRNAVAGEPPLTARAVTRVPRDAARDDEAMEPPVVGFERRFDPVAAIDRARSLSGLGDSATLEEIEARYVASSGEIDLDHAGYDASVTYRFEVKDVAGGAESVVVQLDRRGVVLRRAPHIAAETTAPSDPATAATGCLARDLWQAAMAEGVPQTALATLHYNGLWQFDIESTRGAYVLVFDAGCEKMLSAPWLKRTIREAHDGI